LPLHDADHEGRWERSSYGRIYQMLTRRRLAAPTAICILPTAARL